MSTKKNVTLRGFEAEKLVELNKELDKMNALLKKKSVSKADYDAQMADLTNALSAYNLATTAAVYDELSHENSPMVAAVKMYTIPLHRITDTKNDAGTITEMKLGEKSTKIDLEHFCSKKDYDLTWSKECGQLLALLTLKKLKDYDITKLSSAELSKKSNAFIKYAFEKHAGFTPDSNTKIVKLIQSIVDRVLGEGTYKATYYDINFIYDCVTKIDRKSKCAIEMVNDRTFRAVMFEVFAHALGEAYKVTGTRCKFDQDGNEMKSVYAAEKSAATPAASAEVKPENNPAPAPEVKPEVEVKASKKSTKKSAA